MLFWFIFLFVYTCSGMCAEHYSCKIHNYTFIFLFVYTCSGMCAEHYSCKIHNYTYDVSGLEFVEVLLSGVSQVRLVDLYGSLWLSSEISG